MEHKNNLTEDQVAILNPIITNVGRLIDDATLLIQNGRLPTAFVLNVIALEEVGKVALARWKMLGLTVTSQKRTGHLQKQWAVACLQIASLLLPIYKQELKAGSVLSTNGLERLAEAFIDSTERDFFENVIARNVDRYKQLGLYEDTVTESSSQIRDDLDASAIVKLADVTSRALPLLLDDAVLTLASIFYEITPPLQSQMLSNPARLVD